MSSHCQSCRCHALGWINQAQQQMAITSNTTSLLSYYQPRLLQQAQMNQTKYFEEFMEAYMKTKALPKTISEKMKELKDA